MHSLNDHGYSEAIPVFDRREMLALGETLADVDVPRTRAGMRHVLRVPAVRTVAEHPALIALAAAFIGGQPFPFRATLFDKSAESNWLVAWHQDVALPVKCRIDCAEWGPWSTKGGVLHAIAPGGALASVVALRVHLDDSTDANGPLRVLPGTHMRGVLEDSEIRTLASAVTPAVCLSPSGGVVAMRPLVVHASSKATDGQPRRVLHIEYAASVDLGQGVELAVE